MRQDLQKAIRTAKMSRKEEPQMALPSGSLILNRFIKTRGINSQDFCAMGILLIVAFSEVDRIVHEFC